MYLNKGEIETYGQEITAKSASSSTGPGDRSEGRGTGALRTIITTDEEKNARNAVQADNNHHREVGDETEGSSIV